ncbi:MAG: transporter [Burkholderiales bacterium]|nr:transporter [Burkholderiales bacterium]
MKVPSSIAPRGGLARALLLTLAGFLLAAGGVRAQEMEPRIYTNLPVGMNFLVAAYGRSSGGLAVNPALPLKDAHLNMDIPVLGYAHAFDAWGKSARFDAVIPGGCLSGTAEVSGAPVSRDVCGGLDPGFRVSVNFFGAPALTLKEFRSYKQDLIAGASLLVSPPLGQYDPGKLVNLGTNVWTIRPDIGISKALGPITLEAGLAANFFIINHDFFGGRTREQDPVYSTRANLIYTFRNGIWASLNGTYYTGGRSTVDGVVNDDLIRSSRTGATLAFPINRHQSVKLFASSGISVRTGTDFDIFGVGWQYRWGAGL